MMQTSSNEKHSNGHVLEVSKYRNKYIKLCVCVCVFFWGVRPSCTANQVYAIRYLIIKLKKIENTAKILL